MYLRAYFFKLNFDKLFNYSMFMFGVIVLNENDLFYYSSDYYMYCHFLIVLLITLNLMFAPIVILNVKKKKRKGEMLYSQVHVYLSYLYLYEEEE